MEKLLGRGSRRGDREQGEGGWDGTGRGRRVQWWVNSGGDNRFKGLGEVETGSYGVMAMVVGGLQWVCRWWWRLSWVIFFPICGWVDVLI